MSLTTSMLRSTAVLVAITAASSSAVRAAGESHSDENGLDISEIRKAWEVRERRISTVRVEWIQERTDMMGSHTDLPGSTGEIFPKEDTTFSNKCLLLLDDSKARYEFDGQAWFGQLAELQPRKYVCTFDGETCRSLRVAGGVVQRPQGVIYAEKRHFTLTTMDVAPLSWYYRPLDSSPEAVPLTDLAVDPKIVEIDGYRCIRARPSRGFNTTLWLDPEIGYAVRRYVSGPAGSPRSRIDVSYKQQPDGEWMIDKWVAVRYSGTDVLRKQVNTIRDVSHKGPVQPNSFDLEFPDNTVIVDLRGRP